MFWSLTRSSIFCARSSAVLLKKTSRAFSFSRLFVSLFNVVFANLVRSNLREVLRLRPFGGANKYYDVAKKSKRACLGRADNLLKEQVNITICQKSKNKCMPWEGRLSLGGSQGCRPEGLSQWSPQKLIFHNFKDDEWSPQELFFYNF